MIIRNYTAGDGAAVISLWNICLPPDRIDEYNFYRRVICDINFDPELFLLAEENGELLGFVYGTKRRVPDEINGLQPEQAWIVAMGVHPSRRNQGAGKSLLDELEARLANAGIKSIDVGPYTNNYFCPGVDKKAYAYGIEFLKENGYAEKNEVVSMDLNLRGYEYPARHLEKKRILMAEGYRFKFFRYSDSLPLFNFMREHFNWWLPEVRGSILAGRAEKTVILAYNPDGEVVGFAMRAMDGCDERFGPFGVSPNMQGKGVGGVLFHELVSSMAAARFFYTWFLWTGGRNLDIYGAWGMKVYRSYSMMGKKFN